MASEMTDDRFNWRWPAKRGNNYKPWYRIAWHCLWAIPTMATLILFLFCAAIGWGPAEARRVLREVW